MNPTGGVNVTPSMLDAVRVTRKSFAVLVVTCGVGTERAALSSLFALDQPPPPVLLFRADSAGASQGAEIVEITGLVDLDAWPDGTRPIDYEAAHAALSPHTHPVRQNGAGPESPHRGGGRLRTNRRVAGTLNQPDATLAVRVEMRPQRR